MGTKFLVYGAESATGVERTMELSADSLAGAESAARGRGMLVSEVRLIGGNLLDKTANFTPAARHTPDYPGLRIGRGVLRVFAIFYYLAALISAFAFVAAVMNDRGPERGTFAGIAAISWSVYILGCVMVGGLFHALGEACTALRDIAINSHEQHRPASLSRTGS